MYNSPFKPCGNSILIAATSTPATAVQISTGNLPGMRVQCTSNALWFAVSSSSSVLLTIPTTAAAANGIGCAAANKNFVEVFDVGPNAWVSFGTTGGSAKGFITPGIGT